MKSENTDYYNHKISVFDNALPESLYNDLYAYILANGRNLSSEKITYWNTLDERNNLFDQVIITVKKYVDKYFYNEEIIGAEWWVNYTHKKNMGHVLHRDIDDQLYFKSKKVSKPVIGSVLYFNYENGLSGNLALSTSPYSKSYVYVPPEPNRLILFDAGNLPHGVTNEYGEVVDLDTKGEKVELHESENDNNIRISLPINWWDHVITNPKKFTNN